MSSLSISSTPKLARASTASLRVDVKKSHSVSPFSASSISPKALAARVPKVRGIKQEPAASKEFFFAFHQKKNVIEELAASIKANLDSLHQIALLVKKEADDHQKASTLYTKITSGLDTLKTQISETISYLDNYSKENPLPSRFTEWVQKTKKELTSIRDKLKKEYIAINELYKKEKPIPNLDPVTVDGVTPIPASFQEMFNRFLMRNAEVIESSLTLESETALRQIIKDFQDAMSQVTDRKIYLILDLILKQMNQSFKAIPEEIEKSQKAKEFRKTCNSLTQELAVMTKHAEASLKKRDLKVLSTMPKTFKEKLDSTETQIKSVIKKASFLEKGTVDEELLTVKKAESDLEPFIKKIQTAIPDLKKPATKRKDSPTDFAPKREKKIKVVMSFSEQALKLLKQMQRTLVMQSWMPNIPNTLAEFAQIKQQLSEKYKDSEKPVTLLTLFQMIASEDINRVKKSQNEEFSPSEKVGSFAAFCLNQIETELGKITKNLNTYILPLLDDPQKEEAQKWLVEFSVQAKTI